MEAQFSSYCHQLTTSKSTLVNFRLACPNFCSIHFNWLQKTQFQPYTHSPPFNCHKTTQFQQSHNHFPPPEPNSQQSSIITATIFNKNAQFWSICTVFHSENSLPFNRRTINQNPNFKMTSASIIHQTPLFKMTPKSSQSLHSIPRNNNLSIIAKSIKVPRAVRVPTRQNFKCVHVPPNLSQMIRWPHRSSTPPTTRLNTERVAYAHQLCLEAPSLEVQKHPFNAPSPAQKCVQRTARPTTTPHQQHLPSSPPVSSSQNQNPIFNPFSTPTQRTITNDAHQFQLPPTPTPINYRQQRRRNSVHNFYILYTLKTPVWKSPTQERVVYKEPTLFNLQRQVKSSRKASGLTGLCLDAACGARVPRLITSPCL